nr:MAG TPA: hypothetical protein [Caudoviricetes sp.]
MRNAGASNFFQPCSESQICGTIECIMEYKGQRL